MERLRTLRDTAVLVGEWAALEVGARNRGPAVTRATIPGRLAFFAWALPPNSNAGVYRPLSFLRYGAAHGWQIEAFHGEPPANQSEHGEELERLLPAEVRRRRVPDDSRVPSYRWYPRVDGGFKQAVAYARRAIADLAGNPPHAVFASGPPFFVFVAAYFVAQRFGVPLILDYRDEWSECPFDFVDKSGHDRFWERRCLARAQAVIFTTRSHLEHQCRVFPELRRERTHVVHNGWEPSDFPDFGSTTFGPAKGDAFTLSYVGHLANYLGPKEFLDESAELLRQSEAWQRRLRLTLIGRRSPDVDAACRDFPFADNLVVVDHVGKREAARRMAASDALLLLGGNAWRRYRPGKLYDYVAAGRPILVCAPPGEAWEVVSRLGIGVYYDGAGGGSLLECLGKLASIDMAARRPAVLAWLDEHRRDALAERAFSIIAATLRPAVKGGA